MKEIIIASAALLLPGSAAFAQNSGDEAVIAGYLITEALGNLPSRPLYFGAGPLKFKDTSTGMLNAFGTAVVFSTTSQVEGPLHIPHHVSVGNYRFEINGLTQGCLENCNMTSVNVPHHTRTIPANCFANCYNLSEVTMGDDVTFVENAAFCRDSSLRMIHLPSGVKYIGDFCFEQSGLEEFVVPKSIEYLGQNAFRGCKSLRKVTFTGHRLKELSGYMFEGCEVLEEVILPQGLESILSYAFKDTGLKQLTIPSSVSKIYSYAFNNTPLERLNLLSKRPPETGKLFTAAQEARIELHIPRGTLAAYRNAPLWKNFTTIIDDL